MKIYLLRPFLISSSELITKTGRNLLLIVGYPALNTGNLSKKCLASISEIA